MLAELCERSARELTMASDARASHGRFAQSTLWRSTLPLGIDVARRRRKYVSANVADSFPLIGTACGSPQGIPLGYAVPGRTLERLDPFDPAHPNHLLLINGMSGAGKTMAAIILLARAIAHGASGFIIDRAGHFDFLASLLPGREHRADRRRGARDQLLGRAGPGARQRREGRLSAGAARAAARRAPRRTRQLRPHRPRSRTCSGSRSSRCTSAAR